MELVLLTALGVGGATVIGAVIGFFVKDVNHKTNDIILGFAAGIMLAAAINGLIVPAFDAVGMGMLWLPVTGIFAGALFLNMMDRLTPHLHKLSGVDIEDHSNNRDLNRAILFVLAVALHNLPEGYAVPEDRVKPWGTGQAVLCARNIVHEPFAVINADDYYGKEAYRKVHDYLVQEREEDGVQHICMAGFILGNTLSENGGVTRGICRLSDGCLSGVD